MTENRLKPTNKQIADRMESSNEDELYVAALLLIKKRRRARKPKRSLWVNPSWQSRENFGIRELANFMTISNRESYFK